MMRTEGLIDSHAHLDFADFADDREQVLERAWQAGLQAIVCVGLGRDGAEQAVALAAGDERLRATVGIHPHDAHLGVEFPERAGEEVDPELLAEWQRRLPGVMREMERLARQPGVVAMGEVGLDYHYDFSPRPLQRELFAAFIDLARRLGLPLVIHSREAAADTVAIMRRRQAAACGGVFHCFGGDALLQQAAREFDFYLGLAGPLTFKNAEGLRRVAAELPLERLLVETDCPYLAPVPYRGRRNEPAHVVEVARRLAEIRKLPLEKIARVTSENARRLFRMG